MADGQITIVENTAASEAAAAKSLGLETSKDKRAAALERLEKRKAASGKTQTQRKNQARKVQDGKIAATNVRKYAGFAYADGRVTLVPMTPKTATTIGLPLSDGAFMRVAGNRLLGTKQVSRMKNKKIKVSYGMAYVDRKKATKGRRTGRTGRSRALSKGLVRRWVTVNVPLDASNVNILYWIESSWKKVPQLCMIGEQVFPLRSAQAVNARPSSEALVKT
jgi:hypothetical protein